MPRPHPPFWGGEAPAQPQPPLPTQTSHGSAGASPSQAADASPSEAAAVSTSQAADASPSEGELRTGFRVDPEGLPRIVHFLLR